MLLLARSLHGTEADGILLRCSGSGGEGQHASSIFATSGLVRAEDVGPMHGHEAFYQSHTVFGHEFVDTSHVILGDAPHDAPAHASSATPFDAAHISDHPQHGPASHETALHTAAGHDSSDHSLSLQVWLLANYPYTSHWVACKHYGTETHV